MLHTTAAPAFSRFVSLGIFAAGMLWPASTAAQRSDSHILDGTTCHTPTTAATFSAHMCSAHSMCEPAPGKKGYAYAPYAVFAERSDCTRALVGLRNSCEALRGDCSSIPAACSDIDARAPDANSKTNALELAIAQYVTAGKIDPAVGELAALQIGYSAGSAFNNWIKNAAARAKAKTDMERRAREQQEQQLALERERRRDEAWARLSTQMNFPAHEALVIRIQSTETLDLRSIKLGDPAQGTKPDSLSAPDFDGTKTTDSELTADDLVRGRPRECYFATCREPRGNYPETPVDLRRGIFLARQTMYAPAGQAVVLWEQAMNAAAGDPSLQKIEIPADEPPVDSVTFHNYQQVSRQYLTAKSSWLSALGKVDDAEQRQQIVDELYQAAKAQINNASGEELVAQRLGLEQLQDQRRAAAEAVSAAQVAAVTANIEIEARRDAVRQHIRFLAFVGQRSDTVASFTNGAITYTPTGKGLIEGFTAIDGFYVPVGSEHLRPAQERHYAAIQAGLSDDDKRRIIDSAPYNFMIGLAFSETRLDLKRILFDQFTLGSTSNNTTRLTGNLKRRWFTRLDCHSNGAMVCLGILTGEIPDAKADHVRLFGPQISPASIEQWQKLINTGAVRSIEMYLNPKDPVPFASYGFGPAQLESLVRYQAPGIKISYVSGCLKDAAFPVYLFGYSFDCHSFRAYQDALTPNQK